MGCCFSNRTSDEENESNHNVRELSNSKTNQLELILSNSNHQTPKKKILSNKNLFEDPSSLEYDEIKQLFMKRAPKDFNIVSVKKIINPYLDALFTMRKKEYEILYGNVEVVNVFHGTSDDAVTPIIHNNFNWRLCKRGKFGDGVSFSPFSYYSSNYCADTEIKCMFVVKMLKSHSLISDGDFSMAIPQINPMTKLPYDTSENDKGTVCVKYRDDEFIPSYVIKFTGQKAKKSLVPKNVNKSSNFQRHSTVSFQKKNTSRPQNPHRSSKLMNNPNKTRGNNRPNRSSRALYYKKYKK